MYFASVLKMRHTVNITLKPIGAEGEWKETYVKLYQS